MSAQYDWMNAWPHGVIVVPTVATTASQYAAEPDPLGTRREEAALPQSGCDSKADAK